MIYILLIVKELGIFKKALDRAVTSRNDSVGQARRANPNAFALALYIKKYFLITLENVTSVGVLTISRSN